MAKRFKLKKSKSKKLFKKTSGKTHIKNFLSRTIMRGGYRL